MADPISDQESEIATPDVFTKQTQDLIGGIKAKPLAEREPEYQKAMAKMLPAQIQAGVNVKKAEIARDVDVKESGARESQRVTEEQRLDQKGFADKLDKNAIPTFQPSQEDLTTYAQLGSSIVTLGMMLGGGGKVPAKAALASMTGMLNGWRTGRKELYERESKNFEKESQRLTAVRKSIQDDMNQAMSLYPTRRKDAIALIESARYKAGSESVLGAMLYKGNYDGAMKLLESARKTDEAKLKHEQDIAAKKQEAQLRRADRKEDRDFRREMAQTKAIAKAADSAGSSSEYVKSFTGSKLKDKEANQVMVSANAVGDAFGIKQMVADHPEWVGRTGQVKNIFNRTIESINLGEPSPDDQGQPELIFAKRYAEYLVNYERSLAGGAKGFTVAFQQRFNKLLEQNQFNAAGMSNLMDEQVRTITANAATIAPKLNRQNIIQMAYDVKSRAGDEESIKAMRPLIGGGSDRPAPSAAKGTKEDPIKLD